MSYLSPGQVVFEEKAVGNQGLKQVKPLRQKQPMNSV